MTGLDAGTGLADPARRPASPHALAAALDHCPARPYRVLVVDDEPESLRVMLEVMRDAGLEMASAVTASAALRNAPRVRPDLILLDVMLPDGDGFALCRGLKAHPETAAVPVIFLTGRAGLDDKVAGFGAGGVDYVTKPCAAEEVLLRVLSHLDLDRRQRSLAERLSRYEPEGSNNPADALPPLELPASAPASALRILLKARDALLADLCNPPALESLASELCTNRTTLGRLFKQHLGMSVFDYLREQRLQQGRRLLASTAKPVWDVAASVGYLNGRDFCTAFKRRFGVTPAAYRSSLAESPGRAAVDPGHPAGDPSPMSGPSGTDAPR